MRYTSRSWRDIPTRSSTSTFIHAIPSHSHPFIRQRWVNAYAYPSNYSHSPICLALHAYNSKRSNKINAHPLIRARAPFLSIITQRSTLHPPVYYTSSICFSTSSRIYHRSPVVLHGNHPHHHVEEPKSDPHDPQNQPRAKAMTNITVIGMISNIGLAILKGIAGFFGNSVALIADAAHSISDLLTDFVTIWVSKVSMRPANASHPYGHGKFESLGAMLISGLLIATAGGISWQSYENLMLIINGKGLGTPTGIAVVAAIISIGVKEFIFQQTMRVGNKYNSNVIKANAWHHRSDAISSLVALVGVVGAMYGFPVVDPIAGALVSLMILKAAGQLGWDSLKDLTDQNVDEKVLRKVTTILHRLHDEGIGVQCFHALRGRRMGPYMVLDVNICVDPTLSVSASHQIAERARLTILEDMPSISEILVHVDIVGDSLHHGISANDILHRKYLEDHDHEHDHEHGHNSSYDNLPLSEQQQRLMRPQREIERDVRSVLAEDRFRDRVLSLTHFTCHYVNEQLSVQLEVVMDSSMSIQSAIAYAQQIERSICEKISDIKAVDVHLELTKSHILMSPPLEKAKLGDLQQAQTASSSRV